MRGTGSVTGVVPKPAADVFAFLTDIDRRALLVRIRSRRLRREVPASVDALTRAMDAAAA